MWKKSSKAQQRAEQPVHKAQQRAEQPVHKAQQRAEQPVHKAQQRAEQPVHKAQQRAEQPVHKAQQRAEQPVHKAQLVQINGITKQHDGVNHSQIAQLPKRSVAKQCRYLSIQIAFSSMHVVFFAVPL